MEKFPDHIDAPQTGNGIRSPSPLRQSTTYPNGNGTAVRADRWAPAPRRENGFSPRPGWSNGHAHGRDHNRQKSLGDAFRTIRARNGSMSQNAHEIAGALRAPVSPRLIFLCLLWYSSSALTNTSSKSILNAFDMPATLTLVQFAFVSSLCIMSAWLATIFPVLRTKISALKYPIRAPSRDVIASTLPLAAFQIAGHLLSSTATAKIPVSLVHTIKGLSPLFTVLAYRFIFDIRYPKATYLSLVPLTLGVMLACSGKHGFGGQVLGIVEAFLATIIFVTQNIFSKRLFNDAARAESEGNAATSRKLDKLNLLCYSSGMAFILTLPIWFWSEGIFLLKDFLRDGAVDLSDKPNAMDHGRLTLEFVFNGIFHFGQNILAFVLLSMVSPVTYSVASLIKRVFVIVVAIIWFRNPTTPIQALGIGLTFLGLYLYDRSNESNKADRKARSMADARNGLPILPLNTNQNRPASVYTASPLSMGSNPHPYTEGYFGAAARAEDSKKSDDGMGRARSRASSNAAGAGWLPPGTKQEETWLPGNRAVVA
ncbi:triose-phosphate transporter family-domain-containing protein [Stachybotrys elegans]|uniref:Triose-phosphate transporter family-domain-containing protein n=1 Tax=Stachybotrys elegans TaxID=80388 RepID=A0A8K0WNC2_9HYPO|nr:triose-phosphate transporter family-domain-containing protein [Stachybotrys elegans]